MNHNNPLINNFCQFVIKHVQDLQDNQEFYDCVWSGISAGIEQVQLSEPQSEFLIARILEAAEDTTDEGDVTNITTSFETNLTKQFEDYKQQTAELFPISHHQFFKAKPADVLTQDGPEDTPVP